ncbi:MAG: right-handed parallel beta-helix repeat-containing protein [Verrucomicrobia bacterium]|nr:right-handed parallel beta-helix repeat-containing protein [Verrucomicrobiota bacterium]
MKWKICFSMLLLAFACRAGSAAPAAFYVAANGKDTNPGTEAKPFATLERARDAIRQSKIPNPKSKIEVLVRRGTYALPQTLKLDARDNGVTWRAYKNEKPIIIGGKQIADFALWKGGILKANVGAQGVTNFFRQLFFDGKRMHLARYPNYDPQNPYGGGWAYADGKPWPMYAEQPGENRHTLQFKPANARPWARPEEGEVFVFARYNWWNNIVRIKSVDREQRTITLVGDCSYPIRTFDRYYIRGLLEELDVPGEWYLDKKEKTLYFWPPAPLKKRAVYAPTMRTILELGAGTTDVTFRGFTFECSEGTAITLNNATNCLIAGCVIRNVGDYNGSGVSVNGGQNNGVAGCDIYEVGSSGVGLNGGDRITLTPANNFADNNYIHHVGVFYKQGVGVSMSGCGNRASHNLIHDGPRMGIMFGGNNLVIEYNHIRHMNLETEDTGAVYTGGRDWIGSRGSVIRYNYFHDMLGYGHDDKGRWLSPHFAWGVYLDDNTGGVDVIGNIVARCSRASLHLHNGRDNLIENNVFVDGRLVQVEYSGWTDKHRYWTNHLPSMIKGYESVASQPAWKSMRNMKTHPTQAVLPDHSIMSGNVLKRNIIAWRDPKPKLYGMRNVAFDRNECDYNLLWHYGQPMVTGIQKIKESTGPNLAPNAGFEEGKPGSAPKDWKWQVKPNDSKAVLDANVKFSGKQSLRIEGRGTATDSKGTKLSPNFVSAEINAKTGQFYRLSARIRAAEPDTKFALMAQSYIDKVYFWAKDTSATAGTDWKEYEVLFRFPAPGDRDHKEQMKSFRVRLDVRQPAGTIWVDDVTVREAVAMDEWASWQAAGNDTNSLVADPLFVNAKKDDYRLKKNSPAFKLGFKPIPVENIGPYKSPLRASWPIKEAEGAREHPLVSE